MSDTLARVIDATSLFCEGRPVNEPLNADSAVCQDAYVFGVDVEDYVWALEEEFGEVAQIIPWLRYTDQTSSFRVAAQFWSCPG